MQFHPYRDKLILEECLIDPALLYLGISALEQTKTTTEYQLAKGHAVLQRTLQRIRSAADAEEEETIARAAFLSKCPTEPAVGRSATVSVALGSSNNSDSVEVLRRRFEGDDTLLDVLHWLGAHGTQIYYNLQPASSSSERLHRQNQNPHEEWVLLDVHRQVVLDIPRQANDTLQYLECWPSGRLQVTTRALANLQGIPTCTK